MYVINHFDNGKVESLILLIIAIAIDAYMGQAQFLFRFLRHPVIIIGDFIKFLDEKLNRQKRSERDRAIRGFLSVVIVTSMAIIIGYMVTWLSVNHQIGWIVELIFIVFLLAGRQLYDSVNDVRKALDTGGIEAGRLSVSNIVGRDTASLDAHGVARAAIESLAENFSDAVIAPTFWYILFGFPGLLVAKAINTMDSMIGYKTPKYKAFGMASARFDDILNLVPARLASVMIAIAALFAAKASPVKAISTMFRDGSRHRSLNAGWPEAAMAGALDIALAGPRNYSSGSVDDNWIGSGRARVTSVDIARALYIYLIASLINFGLILVLTMGVMP